MRAWLWVLGMAVSSLSLCGQVGAAASTVVEDRAWMYEVATELPTWYVGSSAALVLPQGGGGMRRLGGAAVRAGRWLDENWALEGEAAWLEDRAGLAAHLLMRFSAWEEFGLLFGYERLDPFAKMGARGWIAGEVGPSVGLGTYYHLTDQFSLRAEAEATLGLNGADEMVYSLGLGLEYTF